MATRKNSKNNIAGLYDLEETLGKGHFAVVKAARHVFTNERVAVKVIDKLKLDTASSKAILKEVLCMKLVQHRNVVKLYEVIDTSSKLFLILELGRGDLYDLIQRGELSEPTARRYFIQIFQAVSYCHKLHVVHRDLKPENVVYFPDNDKLHGGMVKLTDFGFSNNYRPGEKLDTSCGSLAYSAPEILLGDAYDAPAVDIWSLGVILYTLVTGHPPFQEANDSETLTMIMDVKYKIPPTVSMECADLIKKMLQRLPEKRISIFDIQNHEWIRGWAEEGEQGEGETPLINKYKLTLGEREKIIQQMIEGGVVKGEEQVVDSLATNAYNYITSTYYLLAERLLRERSHMTTTTNDEIKNLTSSLESLSSIKPTTNTRRASICGDDPPEAPPPPPEESPKKLPPPTPTLPD
ncbi:SNF-related serine/threonine-protein kinase [Folsomia candida]|uniref:SNF-related serine/threonine-protein kinase n=1 Tax=Folsomia candida TaxID=158441 RepID=UPI000B8F57EC|nr:SNF-related serine/threonine-protein kinase [Folsomia candida]